LRNRSTSASTTGHTIPDPPSGGQEQRERRSFERREQVGVVSECHRMALLERESFARLRSRDGEATEMVLVVVPAGDVG
jgi:hypothetical protein